MTSKEPTLEITITDIAPDGSGIGFDKQQAIAVPFTIPGETLTVHLTDKESQPQRGKGIVLLDASLDRLKPRCLHFYRCGGCQWQHMTYEAQLALKTDIVLSILEAVGGFLEPPVQPTIPSPILWEYTHQVRFYRTAEGDLGFRGIDSRQVIPIEECHIIEADLLKTANELDFDLDTLTELRMMRGDHNETMLVIRTRDDIPPELESNIPLSINFLLKDKEPLNLVGHTHVLQTIHGRSFRVTAGVDFRSHRHQIERLIEIVLHYLNPQTDDVVFDLYGGAGLFSAFIAPQVNMVTYVDSYPPAATDAESNLADFANIDIIEGSVQEILENLVDDLEDGEHHPYTSAILDPPYTGLSEAVVELLCKVHIPRLVYVSSNPESLAKDLKQLTETHVYHLIEVQPIDFAPQTAYIQCVALLESK